MKKSGLIALPEKRGLSRIEAAEVVGVSPTLFDAMVADGSMPRPKKVGRRLLWDSWEINRSFSALPDETGRFAGNSPYDEVRL